MLTNTMLPVLAQAEESQTPIKHVIVIIGENRTFDHIFATYKPVNQDEKVWNLLSKKIVNADGSPGPNYHKASAEPGYGHREPMNSIRPRRRIRRCRRLLPAARRPPMCARRSK